MGWEGFTHIVSCLVQERGQTCPLQAVLAASLVTNVIYISVKGESGLLQLELVEQMLKIFPSSESFVSKDYI